MESKLNSLDYTNPEIIDITFLQSLDKFKPENIVEYKKQQKRTKLTDKQIIAYGKHTNKDYTKFTKFKTSVKGGDAPKDVKGKEMGTWIAAEEKRRFLNEVWHPQGYDDLIRVKYLPISEPIMKKIIGVHTVRSFHYTDAKHYGELKKLQGSSKALATFQTAFKGANIVSGNSGLLTNGGVMVVLEGNLLLKSFMDLHSVTDKNGRRWLHFEDVFPGEAEVKYRDFKKYLDNDTKFIKAVEDLNTVINDKNKSNAISSYMMQHIHLC